MNPTLDSNLVKNILLRTRYFRAKDTGINSLEVVDVRPLGDHTWWVEVTADNADPYRMVIDQDLTRDTLAEEATATELLDHLELLGEVETFTTPQHHTSDDSHSGHAFVGSHARGMGVEQSNTSLIVDDSVALKVFRQLAPGTNRDVDTLSGLARVGSTVAPRLKAVWRDGDRVTAYAQDLVPGARDAWDCAQDVDQAQLRAITDQMHRDLAAAFPTEIRTGDEIADSLIARLPNIAALDAYRQPAIDLFNQVREIPEVPVQRIHGDYHLGQVLVQHDDTTGQDQLFVIDFEGEPARSLQERNAADSPLRDIAGMIRSLGYAGLDASVYAPERSLLLDAYVLDKALYEVAYELANRPDWAHIPLKAVEEILGTSS